MRLARDPSLNYLKADRRLAQLTISDIHNHHRLSCTRRLLTILSNGIELRLIEREMEERIAYLSSAGIIRSSITMRPRLSTHHPAHHCQCDEGKQFAVEGAHP